MSLQFFATHAGIYALYVISDINFLVTEFGHMAEISLKSRFTIRSHYKTIQLTQ